jgi:hypothetical protein
MTTDARFRHTLKSLLAALGSSEPTRRQEARQTIRDTLGVNQKSWNDLLTTLQFRGQHSEKLKKLFAMLGQDNDGEFDNARQKISDLLARERRTWKAFVDSLFSTSSNAWSDWHDHGASDPSINPLDLVHHLLWRYVEMTPQQFVAVSLWIAHTFVFQRFTVTPRLVVTSPVRGRGKTTLLDLLEVLCVRPLKSESITAASIYHAVDREHPTLLIDEADNLGLAFNGALRAVLNSGHRRGGKVTRYHSGQARSLSTFSPVAVAAIGTLPLPQMHRSIVIHMARRDGRRQLTRLDKDDPDRPRAAPPSKPVAGRSSGPTSSSIHRLMSRSSQMWEAGHEPTVIPSARRRNFPCRIGPCCAGTRREEYTDCERAVRRP